MSPMTALLRTHQSQLRKLLVPLTVLALTLTALAVTTGAAAPASASTTIPYRGLVKRMVATINSLRAQEGLPALKLDSRLSAVAVPHSRLMASHHSYVTRYSSERPMAASLSSRNFYARNTAEALGSARTRTSLLRRPRALRRTSWSSVFSKSMSSVGVGVVHRHHRYWVTVVVAQPGRPAPAAAPVQQLGSSYAQSILDMLNNERRAHGLPKVTMNQELIVSAHGHNLDMAAANEMSHQLPGEPYFADRISNAGYKYWYAGENIGWNSVQTLDGVRQLETIMYNEKAPDDGHRQNILSKNYTNVGIDVYFDNTNGKVWLTEDFGKPAYW